MSHNRVRRHPHAGKMVEFNGSTISLTPHTDGEALVEDWWANLPEDRERIRHPFPNVELPDDAVYVYIGDLGHWISDKQIVRVL
jgi:hypothetical protein